MRWLAGLVVMSGCAGSGGPTPDAVFSVEITNSSEDCGKTGDGSLSQSDLKAAFSELWPLNLGPVPNDFCPCTDEDASAGDCYGTINRQSQSLSYELHQDGDAISIRVDGETFATGTLRGCNLDYESPVWLEQTAGGEVQWSVQSVTTTLDMNGACASAFTGDAQGYDFLGIEEVEVVGSNDEAYPIGRTVWKMVAGKRQGG